MKLTIPKSTENILVLMRRLGYYPQRKDALSGEISFTRPIARSNYPRFHVYVEKNADALQFALHLDQKQTSYSGTLRHGGEYGGKLVEEELKRIKKLLNA